MSRLDIMQPRNGSDGKTYWTKLGSAWPAKTGNGYSLTFEALPMQSLNENGQLECRVLLREPLPPRDAGGYDRAPAQRPASRAPSRAAPPMEDDLNDEVPF
jgi:hypothetical protein